MQHLELMAVIVTIVSVYLLLSNTKLRLDNTLSEHAARSKKLSRNFAIAEISIAVLYFLYITFWLAPTYSLSWIIIVIAYLGSIGFIVAALYPLNNKANEVFHNTGAYALGISVLLLMPVLVSISNSPLSYIVVVFSLLMLGLFIYGLTESEFHKKYILIFQTSYFAMFHVSLLLITYTQ